MNLDAKTKRLPAPFGDYAVTSDGEVISYKNSDAGEKVKPIKVASGYLAVNLATSDEKHGFKQRLIHLLVAEAFLGPKPEGAEVLHKDANRANPKLSNLKYGTRSENAKQREEDKRADSFVRLDHSFEIGKWERTPEGYLRATAVCAVEGPLEYPEEGRTEFVTEDALISGAESLLHKPVTFEHPPTGEVDDSTWKEYAVGSVVESTYDPDLRAIVAGIVVNDRKTIDAVLHEDIREVSPGYRAAVVPDSTYGFKQVQRFSNHLAITRAGRGGRKAAIRLDSTTGAAPPAPKEDSMTEEEMKKKVADAEAAAEDAKKKADALQAKVDAFEAMAKKKGEEEEEKEDEKKNDSFVQLFNERTSALEVAGRLGVQVDQNWTNAQLKRAVVQKATGNAALRTDSKDALDAAYEAVVTMLPKPNSIEHFGAVAQRNLDSISNPAQPNDMFAAYSDQGLASGSFQFTTKEA